MTAVTAHLNAVAQAMGYDDLRTAVTYADEPSVPRFQHEGRALRACRSVAWAACLAMLDAVRDSTRPQPSIDDVIAALPALGAFE